MESLDQLVAYVFVADAHASDFERLSALPRDRPDTFHSYVRLAGTWDAMVTLTPDRMEDIDDFVLQDVRGGHSPMTQTAMAMGTVRPPGLVTWAASPPFIIISRIRVRRGAADEVMRQIADHRCVLGVAAVAGAFDVLAEFGAETFEEVAAIATTDLAGIEGIRQVDTAFCTKLISASHYENSSD